MIRFVPVSGESTMSGLFVRGETGNMVDLPLMMAS